MNLLKVISTPTNRDDAEKHWLVFGVGSPELSFIGSNFNIGAAVIDLLSEINNVNLKEFGPIKSATYPKNGAIVRLAKPNLVPEMAEDSVMFCKNKCKPNDNCVVLVYGDTAYDAGVVKIKHKGGAAGHKIIESFNRVFGQKDVIRIRVGMGQKGGLSLRNSPYDIADEDANKLMKGIHIAAAVIEKLISDGYSQAGSLATKAAKGRVIV